MAARACERGRPGNRSLGKAVAAAMRRMRRRRRLQRHSSWSLATAFRCDDSGGGFPCKQALRRTPRRGAPEVHSWTGGVPRGAAVFVLGARWARRRMLRGCAGAPCLQVLEVVRTLPFTVARVRRLRDVPVGPLGKNSGGGGVGHQVEVRRAPTPLMPYAATRQKRPRVARARPSCRTLRSFTRFMWLLPPAMYTAAAAAGSESAVVARALGAEVLDAVADLVRLSRALESVGGDATEVGWQGVRLFASFCLLRRRAGRASWVLARAASCDNFGARSGPFSKTDFFSFSVAIWGHHEE